MNTIIFVAGRSGGHLLPALALARKHKKKHPKDIILFITTATTLDKKIVEHQKVIDTLFLFNLPNIPQQKWRYPLYVLQLAYYTLKSVFIFIKHKPTTVHSIGGYISLPVCIAAKILKVPITLHELNALPGRATKFLSRAANQISIYFEETKKMFPKKKIVLQHYPLSWNTTNPKPFTYNGFSPQKKTILILGGSQGSLFINSAIQNMFAKNDNVKSQFQVIHQTGNFSADLARQWYQKNNVTAYTFDFEFDIQKYYAAADIIICRSGAGSLFEAMYMEKPCITIPLETPATDHQVYNAQSMQKKFPELVFVIPQRLIFQKPNIIGEQIDNYFAAH